MSDLPPFRPEDYLCTTCGGFLKLPLRFAFPPHWRRWCLCDYDLLFKFCMEAEEYSQPEEPETPSFNEFLDKFLDDEGKKLGKRIA